MDEPEVYAFLPIAFFLILIISFLQTSKHYFLYFYSFKSVSWIPISLWFDNPLHYYTIHPSSKLTRHHHPSSTKGIGQWWVRMLLEVCSIASTLFSYSLLSTTLLLHSFQRWKIWRESQNSTPLVFATLSINLAPRSLQID